MKMKVKISRLMILVLVLGLTAGVANAALIGHWQLDDGSGLTAADSVAGLDGALGGTPLPAWVSGAPSGLNPTAALDFSGGTDEVATAVTDLMSGLTACTVAAWVKPGYDTVKYRAVVTSRAVDIGYMTMSLEIRPDKGNIIRFGVIAGEDWGSYNYTQGSTSVPFDEWTHIAATYDSATATMNTYFNGVLETPSGGNINSSAALSATDRPIYIGRNPGDSLTFIGGIDDVRIYDGALSEAQIGAIVPEPATLVLLGLGGLLSLRRRHA